MSSYETWDWSAAGWHPQRGYQIVARDAVVHDEREGGHITSTAVGEREARILKNFVLRTDSRDAYENYMSFFRRHRGSGGRFWMSWPELVPSPDAAPILEAISGGSQAQRTITARYAWKNANGTTKASPTGSLLVPATNLVKVTLPVYPTNVLQAVIYAAEDDPGAEEEQTTLTETFQWIQPDAALLTGTADPPAANTATELTLCMLPPQEERPPAVRGVGTTYELVLEVWEVFDA